MAKSDKKEKKSKEVTEKVTESIEVGADVDMEDVAVAKVRGYTILKSRYSCIELG